MTNTFVFVYREKISSLRTNVASPIYIANPHLKSNSHSKKIIHLVNEYEVRVAKPDVIERGIRREVHQNGTSQFAFLDL